MFQTQFLSYALFRDWKTWLITAHHLVLWSSRLLMASQCLAHCSFVISSATVRHCRYLIATLDGVFFRGLVYSMLNGEQDSAAQTAAVDLLRLICRHLHLSIQEVISKQPLTLADENTSRCEQLVRLMTAMMIIQ